MLAAVMVLWAAAVAQPPSAPQTSPAASTSPGDTERQAPEAERQSVTHHTVTIDEQRVEYTATAGTMLLKTEEGKPKASIFYIAYVVANPAPAKQRPIMFAFNGGPGSSSVWLHLGAFGPRRVLMADDGQALPPPYQLVENPYSLLSDTDLVFIDPVTTGFSRSAPGEDPKQFHGVEEDVRSVAEFIRLYVTRNSRWLSPKFLAGESYGTTRAAALAGYLQSSLGMYLNGIVLVSSVLNFQTLEFDSGNDLPYILFLPTYTATAWHHRRLAPELQQDLSKALAEAEQFAAGDYALALMQGDRLSEQEQQRIAAALSRLCGVSLEFVNQCGLRISDQRFTKELLRDQRRTVGRLDSRFTGIDADAAGESNEYDPSYAGIQGPYTAALNHYLRRDLHFESDLPYEILTGRVRPWNYQTATNRYLNVADTLRQAMTKNPSLRVLVANGYYDLATPYFATHYTFDHLGLDPALRDHVTMTHYRSGHMMYIDLASLRQLKQDVSAFIRAAGAPPAPN
jgi:carboxypeptidase C (cathepsin A)